MSKRRCRRRRWTRSELATLRKLYPNAPTSEIAKELDRKVSAVYQKAIKIGLRKSAAYLASPHACRLRRGDNIGASFRFLKGHVPANKGLRRPGWGPGRMKETQFKKGRLAGAAQKKWAPIGTETVDSDGYRKRKISDDRTKPSRFNWKFVHVIAWEERYGAVPPGHAVCFRNGDKSDIRVENLELVRRAELMQRNTVHNLPKPLVDVIRLRGVLRRQIHRRERA